MDGQMTLFPMEEKPKKKLNRDKLNWENAFQKWSDEIAQDGSTSLGCCGYGSMCDFCTGNDYGRPCVRALNRMCRERGEPVIDYSDRSEEYFAEVWYGSVIVERASTMALTITSATGASGMTRS